MISPRQKNDASSTVDVDTDMVDVSKLPPLNRRRLAGMTMLLMVLCLAVGSFIAWKVFRVQKVVADNSAPQVAVKPLTPVRIFKVGSHQDNQAGKILTGIVRPRYETQFSFRIGGKIKSRFVEVGQTVFKGDILFELDSDDYRLQVDNAKANLEVASAAVQRSVAEERRLAELLAARAISNAEYERALADRDIAVGQRQSAERQLDLAKNQLAYCRLIADEAGVITSIDVEAGQVITAGTKLGALAQVSELEAVIDIPENRIPSNTDLTATVKFWSLPGKTVTAKLREISPIADSMTRTFRARLTLVEPPSEIKIGMTVSVEMPDRELDQTLSIPLTSVFKKDEQPHVWLLDEPTASIHPVPVVISRYGDESVFITSGLKRGDKIVSAGVQKLDASLPVRVWELQK